MDKGNRVTADMRMGVLFGGPAMRGPARVCYAAIATNRFVTQAVFQLGDLADDPRTLKHVVTIIDDQAGRVIAAIFQSFQSFNKDRDNIAFGDGADDATHSC